MILIYDGSCPFCQDLATAIEKRTTEPIKIISYHSLAEDELKKIHPELTIERCQGEVQIIQKGKRYPGFFGIRVLLWKVKVYKYFVWILYLPLVPFLGMFVLSLLKRFRSKLT